jgi:hypothetical protein
LLDGLVGNIRHGHKLQTCASGGHKLRRTVFKEGGKWTILFKTKKKRSPLWRSLL